MIQKSKKKFDERDRDRDIFFRKLRPVCAPLKYISETDAEVVPFAAATAELRSTQGILDSLGISSGPVEEVGFEEFFARLIAEKPWHQNADKDRTNGFRVLRDLLDETLSDVRVLRIGRVRIDIYIVGFLSDGRIAGVTTKAVET